MLSALLLLLLAVFLLLISTRAFMSSAIETSLSLRISPLVVGVTVVAIGTSLPELVVSVLAALRNEPGLAIGNIVGSNIVNIFLVFPFSVLLADLKMGISKTQRNAFLMVAVTFAFFFLNVFRVSYRLIGLAFLFLAALFTFQEYRWGIEGRDNEDSRYICRKETKLNRKTVWLLLASLVGIFWSGNIIVRSVEQISSISGISTTFLGLSLAAVATSLPELFFTVIGTRKDEQKAATGNILGSNIYNILLIGGVTLLFSSVPLISGLTWFFFLFSALSFYGLICYFKGRIVPRWTAYLFFLGFLAFLVCLGLN